MSVPWSPGPCEHVAFHVKRDVVVKIKAQDREMEGYLGSSVWAQCNYRVLESGGWGLKSQRRRYTGGSRVREMPCCCI